MNKDQVEGKVKDIAGRVQRQAGEWSDDPEQQVKGAAKQAEGEVHTLQGQGCCERRGGPLPIQRQAFPKRQGRRERHKTHRLVRKPRLPGSCGQALAAEIKLFYMNLRNPSLKKLRIVNRYYFFP